MQLIFVANMDADEVLRSVANVNATTDVITANERKTSSASMFVTKINCIAA